MDELSKINQFNLPHAIEESIELLFFHLIRDTSADYATYILRYPPDKEWELTDIFLPTNEVKKLNELIMFDYQSDKYKLFKSIENFFPKQITEKNIQLIRLPENLLHPNVQVIIILVDAVTVSNADVYIPLLCTQFLKKYINTTDINIIKLLGKIKAPLSVIANADEKTLNNVKTSSLSIASIINDLIDYYKLKKNSLRLYRDETPMKEFMNEIKEVAECNIIIDDDVPEILFIDAKRLKQILLNLLNSNASLYITAISHIDINDLLFYTIEFNIECVDNLKDERLYITKKLISLMDGNFMIDKFTIQAYKNSKSFSTHTLKKIKGKKILILDYNEARRIEIGNRLRCWDLDISFASNDADASMLIKKRFDLYICSDVAWVEKLNRMGITHYLYITESRQSISSATLTLIYPTSDETLLTAIINAM